MATKTQTWAEMAAATGGSAASFSKADADLLRHGYSTKGGYGGGKNTVHVDALYLALMVIAAVLPFPSKAGTYMEEAHRTTFFQQQRRDGLLIVGAPAVAASFSVPAAPAEGTSLPVYLANIITDLTRLPKDLREAAAEVVGGFSFLRLRFNPIVAEVEWLPSMGDAVAHMFRPKTEVDAFRRGDASFMAPKVRAPVYQGGTVSVRLLFVAADLLVNSQKQRGGQLPFSGQGETPASATPENEKTSDPARSEASRHFNQPRNPRATGHSNTPINNSAFAAAQARKGSRGSSQQKESHHNEVRI
jgi:hypothetical protein